MRRREFITLFGGVAVAWPLATQAQQQVMPTIGYLNTRSPTDDPQLLAAFKEGLSETDYIEGQNVMVEYRWAAGQNVLLPELAADLVRREVTVIAANGPSAVAAKAATSIIPIVFITGDDPVQMGLVASLSQPGGNVTGVTTLNTGLGSKRLELLREVVPGASIVALMINPTNPNAETLSKEMESAASLLKMQLHVLHARTESDFDAVFVKLRQLNASGVVIGADAFFNSRSKMLGALTVQHAVPAIYTYRDFALGGGLMSYGGSNTDAFRRLGVYTGRILKGEKAANLPVQEATKVELIINLKTAKALGITVPLTLSGRADEVIE